ncbi:hypothetical protein Tco_1323516 [Tanacetum coccineum]
MRGRMVYANLAEGERFYLCVLLLHVKRPTGFDYLYTVNDVLYTTFRRAALERGLIKSDDHIHACLRESSTHEMPDPLRRLFATLLIYCEPRDVQKRFFIDGPGGTGKTFLYKALLAIVRSRGHIALATALSGATANNMTGERTAHSRFKIPINLTTNSTCNIKKQSSLAKLLCQAKLIIWDEASMAKRQAVEAVDQTMQDIIGVKVPFGGKIMVLGGDFRHV